MDKIIPSHPATFENDYSDILDRVQRKKQMEAIDAFLEKKVKETYIVIDPLFQGCDFTRPIWKSKFSK